MKNKSKKILAGLGLGVMGALALTGCSSDISITQEDLDKTLEGVNNHFATIEDGIDRYFNNQQTHYVGDEAKGLFASLISDVYYNFFKVKNYTMTMNYNVYNTYGVKLPYDSNAMVKCYFDEQNNVYKLFGTIDGVDYYQEYSYNEDSGKYIRKVYNLDEKYYEQYEEDFAFDIYSPGMNFSLQELYYKSLNPDDIKNCSVTKIGEGEYKVTLTETLGFDEDVYISSDYTGRIFSYEYIFKDGYLVKFRDICNDVVGGDPGNVDSRDANRQVSVADYDIVYSCDPINVDTSGCVLRSNN